MSTVQNYGVANGSGGRSIMLMPKLAFKFRVRFFGFGPFNTPLELTGQVLSVGRPSSQTEEVALHSYNSTAYVAGKTTWNTLDITLRDDVTNAVGRIVGHQLQKQKNHFEQTTPLAGSNYKFDMKIEALDGGNDGVLDGWYVENCYIASSNMGEFNVANSEAMTIQLTIRYDNATQEGGLMPLLPELNSGTAF